jgi:hypothetical protein
MNGAEERTTSAGRRDGAATSRRTGELALLAAVVVVALAGCGGSRSPSVASVAPPAPTSSASMNTSSGGAVSGPPPGQAQMQQASLRYARCMRASGVPDFPDPKPGGGFLFQAGAGVDPSAPAFKAAQAKCSKLLPDGGPPGPGTVTHPSAQALAQMVKVAQCMRRHGISGFPDPKTIVPSLPPGGGVISDIDGVILVFPATIDTQSPAFARAAAACRFPLHDH